MQQWLAIATGISISFRSYHSVNAIFGVFKQPKKFQQQFMADAHSIVLLSRVKCAFWAKIHEFKHIYIYMCIDLNKRKVPLGKIGLDIC